MKGYAADALGDRERLRKLAVFAILLMTLTLASMQFSPRIIVSFAKDRVTQWTLGIFLGTFCYCMAALPSARSLPHPFAPVLTVFGAISSGRSSSAFLLAWLFFSDLFAWRTYDR